MYIFDAAIIINLWFLRYQMLNYKYSNHEAGRDGVDVTLLNNKVDRKGSSICRVIY